MDRILSHLWVIIILILAVLLLDSILLFLHQRRTQEQKRIHMIEQYVPIVEELISQVRARQHEFNNRMMAIEAAVASADTLEEARKEVAGLTGSIGISLNDRELLSCDSKMIAGMLFGKIKQAEAANCHIELSLHGLFKKTVTQKHRAGSQHRDIYYSKNLHTLHTGVHAGAETIPSLFRKNRSISFRDTGYPGHHIGCRPRRTSHILVCLGFGDSSSRADGIHILRGTANNTGFLDLAVNPLIHISERNHLYLVLLRRNGSATKHGRQHSQHTNFLLNHFSH